MNFSILTSRNIVYVNVAQTIMKLKLYVCLAPPTHLYFILCGNMALESSSLSLALPLLFTLSPISLFNLTPLSILSCPFSYYLCRSLPLFFLTLALSLSLTISHSFLSLFSTHTISPLSLSLLSHSSLKLSLFLVLFSRS